MNGIFYAFSSFILWRPLKLILNPFPVVKWYINKDNIESFGFIRKIRKGLLVAGEEEYLSISYHIVSKRLIRDRVYIRHNGG